MLRFRRWTRPASSRPVRAAARAVALALVALAVYGCKKKEKEPTYGDQLAQAYRRGKASGAHGELTNMAMAITQYMTTEGGPPAAEDIEGLAGMLEPDFIRRLPRNDPWGTPYAYSTDGTSYTIQAAGHDLQFDTDDDLVLADGQIIKMPKGYTQFNE